MFTTTLASTLAQTETVTATEGSVQETTSVTFVAGPPSATTSTLVASPATVTADGVQATTLTVTVEDAHGNPVANTAVTLSASGSDNAFGTISGTTNAKGVFTTTLASTLAQTETITATEGSVQETTSVTFTAGPPSASNSTIAAEPGNADRRRRAERHADGDGGGRRTAIRLRIRRVTLSGKRLRQHVRDRQRRRPTRSGVFTTTLASTLAQTETVTATEGSVQETTSVTFVAGPPVGGDVDRGGEPGNGDRRRGATTTLTVTVEDAEGNPVAGQRVTLSGSGSGKTFRDRSAGTPNASGRVHDHPGLDLRRRPRRSPRPKGARRKRRR